MTGENWCIKCGKSGEFPDSICDTCSSEREGESLSDLQAETLAKPCKVCGGKPMEVGDLADFDHDIVVCNHCNYAMFYDGTEEDVEVQNA